MLQTRGLTAVAVGLATFLAGPSAAQTGEGVQCGDTLTTSTRLTHDLECPGTDVPALRVAGAGVVLDLGGHTVRRVGPPETQWWSEGIVVVSDSTVRNGTIRGFQHGYVLDSDAQYQPRHVWLSRLTFIDNGAAIHNRSSDATLTLTDSLLLRNGSGLSTEQDASRGTFEVRSSLFFDNGLALSANNHFVDVVHSTFSHNDLVAWCPDGGVTFTSSWLIRNEVVGRLTLGEFGYGFCRVASFVNTVIADNGSFTPTDWPVWEPFDFVLRDSWVVGNGDGPLVRARTVDVRDTTWWGNGGGLTLGDLPEYVPPELTGTVSDNRFLHNRGDGLRVTVPNTLTVSRNVALDNTGWGLYAPGVRDGGGNVAWGNRAGNCLGVTCSFPRTAGFIPGPSIGSTHEAGGGE
jgi:hypothetical protein